MIPMDPLDEAALPPEDLDDCEACQGLGTIWVGYDPETGHDIDDDCARCQGTGVDTLWVIGGAA